MVCRHQELREAGRETAFTIEASRLTFGRDCLDELGERAAALGLRRVALFTDRTLVALPHHDRAHHSLRRAGLEVVTFDEVEIEPTDASIAEAARFARDVQPDGYVSLGGGSVIDTAKLADLLAEHGGPLSRWIAAPWGEAVAVPGPLAPHLACPTTCGTGSEVTGIAVFDLLAHEVKTGVASPWLRPTEALVDPECTRTLPRQVVAASGMDVLSHALESFTARPFTARAAAARATARPLSQGRNPWSDLGCAAALQVLGRHLVDGVCEPDAIDAREQLAWAASLAGIAFGNAGVHGPHGMAYAVAGRVRDYHCDGYPAGAMVPHGIAVIVSAPAVFRHTAATDPARHLQAAAWLGADVRDATPADAGAVLSARLVELMRALSLPNGLCGVGYHAEDVPALASATAPQARLLDNAPCLLDRAALEQLFTAALRYW
ncbi:MAG: iron-containing alcohol dehydrogenase [Nannocystaceae bacterium]|nr:iron-containing alcohol dehydrogenase [Nannocystaceae bacterium]